MLTSLSLHHFVLIDSCMINFEKNLNILTGETGAGKTILIQAIGLLMGQKAAADIIRAGEEKAHLEASFEIQHLPLVHQKLETSGFSFDPNEELIIKREISLTGKNRIFINAQLAPLGLLAQLGPLLFEVAGQNTSIALRSLDQQRTMLDLFGNLTESVSTFSKTYQAEKGLQASLANLKLRKEESQRIKERLTWELEELEEISIADGEEDLFKQYQELNSQKDLSESLSTIIEGLPSITSTLSQYQKELSTLEEPAEHLASSIVHLNEASYLLSSLLGDAESNPKQLESLEKQLSQLNRIKQKYHLEASQIPKRIIDIKEELFAVETLDDQILHAEKELGLIQSSREDLKQKLTENRRLAAKKLEASLTSEIQLLNMPDAICQVEITDKELGPEGSDRVSFLLSANLGEKPAPVKTKTSGGELARLFFTLKLLLAEREAIPILIFDEIDSNIGGETATLIGKKLRELSQHRQVLCITHFPQVAKFATHHLLIAKQTKDQRTYTTISSLSQETKQAELLRMMGGQANLLDLKI